jgi:hypothetical protein
MRREPRVVRRTLVLPDGRRYRLVAGPAARVARDGRDDGDGIGFFDGALAAVSVAVAVLGWAYRVLWWRGRGLVVLRAGPRRRWTWETADSASARAAAAILADWVATGVWVPGAAPPPHLSAARLTPG